MKPNPSTIYILLHCNFVNLSYEDGTGDLAYLTFLLEVISQTGKKGWASKELLKEIHPMEQNFLAALAALSSLES